jgi:uncharacterized membrane protein YphA (DoxX/SURF4 family)
MYTTWNLFGVAAYAHLPAGLQDVVRASSLIVLMVVAMVWWTADLGELYVDLFDSFAAIRIPRPIKIAAVGAADILTHVVPCLLVGLPQSAVSLMAAFLLVMGWYIGHGRERLERIYSRFTTADRGDRLLAVAGLAVIGAAAAYWHGS